MTRLEPGEAGARVAALFTQISPRLFADLVESGAVPADAGARVRAREEWDYFALFGCVRGLVAAKGFARHTVAAIDTMHEAIFPEWERPPAGGATSEARRKLLARRYGEYETIAQAKGASGAHDVADRLGAAAAGHLFAEQTPPADLGSLLGSMHESLAEAVVALLSGEGELRAPAVAGVEAAAIVTDEATTIPSGIATPPLDGAWRVVERLERAGVTCALGGSGLLASLGLATTIRDWDLTTDAPRDRVEAALAGLEWEHKGSDALHADEKFMLPDLELEIIRGFSFHVTGGVVRVPTIVTRRWAGLPVGSPECWVAAYHLLGRLEKRDCLVGWIRSHGATPATLEALLAQPLPPELATLLSALASAGRI